MLYSRVFAALSGVSCVTAFPKLLQGSNTTDVNPFLGKNYFANTFYAGELNETIAAFLAKNDTLNAARTRTVQGIGSFVWVASVSGLVNIENTVKEARAEQKKTRTKQIVQLVLYDLPDRDCSGGESGGEFSSLKNGLELYKSTFVDPYAAAVKAASDLTFAIILEPDSLGNVITNQNVPFCGNATLIYEEGIAYAISKLQAKNIHLYIDAAHGGWLGWDDNLPKGKISSHVPLCIPIAEIYSCRRIRQSPGHRPKFHSRSQNPWFRHRRFELQPIHRKPTSKLHRME